MKTIITLKTDKEVKRTAQRLAGDLGLSLSAVVNASLRQFIRDSGVHFSKIPVMTPELEKIISNREKDFQTGKNISPKLSTPKQVLAYLRAD